MGLLYFMCCTIIKVFNNIWHFKRRKCDVHLQYILFLCSNSSVQREREREREYPTRVVSIVRLKRDGTRAETRFRLSPKRTSPFKPAGASVQSTAGSRCVRISVSNAGYTTFRGSLRVLATHSIRLFPLHFPSRASPCAIRFQTHSTTALETTPSL